MYKVTEIIYNRTYFIHNISTVVIPFKVKENRMNDTNPPPGCIFVAQVLFLLFSACIVITFIVILLGIVASI